MLVHVSSCTSKDKRIGNSHSNCIWDNSQACEHIVGYFPEIEPQNQRNQKTLENVQMVIWILDVKIQFSYKF